MPTFIDSVLAFDPLDDTARNCTGSTAAGVSTAPGTALVPTYASSFASAPADVTALVDACPGLVLKWTLVFIAFNFVWLLVSACCCCVCRARGRGPKGGAAPVLLPEAPEQLKWQVRQQMASTRSTVVAQLQQDIVAKVTAALQEGQDAVEAMIGADMPAPDDTAAAATGFDGATGTPAGSNQAAAEERRGTYQEANGRVPSGPVIDADGLAQQVSGSTNSPTMASDGEDFDFDDMAHDVEIDTMEQGQLQMTIADSPTASDRAAAHRGGGDGSLHSVDRRTIAADQANQFNPLHGREIARTPRERPAHSYPGPSQADERRIGSGHAALAAEAAERSPARSRGGSGSGAAAESNAAGLSSPREQRRERTRQRGAAKRKESELEALKTKQAAAADRLANTRGTGRKEKLEEDSARFERKMKAMSKPAREGPRAAHVAQQKPRFARSSEERASPAVRVSKERGRRGRDRYASESDTDTE